MDCRTDFTALHDRLMSIKQPIYSKNKSYDLSDIGVIYKLKNDMRINAGLYNVFNKEITNDTHGKFINSRRVMLGFVSDF